MVLGVNLERAMMNISQENLTSSAAIVGEYTHSPLILMVIIGLFGGWLSWLNTDYNESYCHRRLARNLITGVLATFMVPLFLQMIGSNLLKDISPNYQNIYVFLGMCSAAAFVCQKFASSISQQLLQKANDKAELAEKTAQLASEKTLSVQIDQIKLQGSMHMIKQEYEEALVFMNEYLKHNPMDSNTLWRKAYCLKRVGDVPQAMKNIDLAIQNSVKPPGMLYFNKSCYMALLQHKVSEIVECLEMALKLDEDKVKIAISKDLSDDFSSIAHEDEFKKLLDKYQIDYPKPLSDYQ